MKWMIIVLIMMSLIGSMMWVMPTKRQKYQAALRLKAKGMGFIVQLEKVKPPRAQGEMEADLRDMTAYRILRQGMSQKEKNAFTPWQIFKVTSVANIGLPEGWCWAKGERSLSETSLAKLNELIECLPDGVFSIESNSLQVGVHWNEEGGEELMEEMYRKLKAFAEMKI